MESFFIALILFLFVIGFTTIVLSPWMQISKPALAILLAGLCWLLFLISPKHILEIDLAYFAYHVNHASQIALFLLGAMTLIEIIDSYKGFSLITDWIQTTKKKHLLWIITLTTFFLSAILENLVTTLLMISILRKFHLLPKDRLFMNSMIVISTNSGGIWSPIGDIATKIFWIENRVSSLELVQQLFLPSLISCAIPLFIYLPFLKGSCAKIEKKPLVQKKEPGGKIICLLALFALIAVPFIKGTTGLPPFMGLFIALGLIWLITDALHQKRKQPTKMPAIFKKIDISMILFFLGIILAINALQAVGILDLIRERLEQCFSNKIFIGNIIGIASSFLGSVPAASATVGMYNLTLHPMNDFFWMLTAFSIGVGGSLLSIGSAASIAMMQTEKIPFMTYLKYASLPAFSGYLGGELFLLYVG